MSVVLKITNLSKSYGNIKALNNLSLQINQGEIFGLLGPNGSGKTTTLGILLSVLNAESGSFSWNDQEPSKNDRKKIGSLLETPNFYPYLSARKNLEIVCKIKSVDESEVDRVLDVVDLLARSNSKFQTFSLGMKQRLAIASALLNDPEILILDEPTNGLDPQGIHEIRKIIKEIASNGTTILLASHLLDEVEKVCSHVVVIRNGVKLYSGAVDGITATNGYFELNIDSDSDELTKLLQEHPAISDVKEEDGKFIATLESELSASEINAYLFKNGITLSHLVKRMPSLEQQFLTLTNNN